MELVLTIGGIIAFIYAVSLLCPHEGVRAFGRFMDGTVLFCTSVFVWTAPVRWLPGHAWLGTLFCLAALLTFGSAYNKWRNYRKAAARSRNGQ